tara:strand:+ start:298 stop:549 length:252 start_codon:yes stop_codon:yes gene_type:complete
MNTDYLSGWDAKAEQQKAEFMEHMYQCSGRSNGLFTGLWQDFCLNEAGPTCRQMFFDRQEAIKKFIELEEQKTAPEFVPTFHD